MEKPISTKRKLAEDGYTPPPPPFKKGYVPPPPAKKPATPAPSKKK